MSTLKPENTMPPAAEKELYFFRKALPLRIKLHEILRFLGPTEGLACLDVGLDNPMMSHHLRRRGGSWQTVVRDPSVKDPVLATVGQDVSTLQGEKLPFENKKFDVLVVSDMIERMESDDAFVEECHRVLKPDGRLILNVTNRKTWTFVTPFRSLFGYTYETAGLVRPGYSESELFRILKHGFDVHGLHSHTRLFVEITDTIVQARALKAAASGNWDELRRRRFALIAGIFYSLASQFDMLVFGRGHYLIATAKRRAWRPRNAPILTDGRSISEAVLSRAAD